MKALYYLNPLNIVGVYAIYRAWQVAKTAELDFVSEMAIVYLLLICSLPAFLINYYLNRGARKMSSKMILNSICACVFFALTIGFF